MKFEVKIKKNKDSQTFITNTKDKVEAYEWGERQAKSMGMKDAKVEVFDLKE